MYMYLAYINLSIRSINLKNVGGFLNVKKNIKNLFTPPRNYILIGDHHGNVYENVSEMNHLFIGCSKLQKDNNITFLKVGFIANNTT